MSDTDTGLLFIYGEPGPDVTDTEFNDWYDNEHAPVRVTVPGFTSATRYEATDALTPTYLALYFLTQPSIASSPPYQALVANPTTLDRSILSRAERLHRRLYTLVQFITKPNLAPGTLPGAYLLLVSFLIPPELEDEFNAWYDEEHLADLSKVPGFLRGRRYKLLESGEIVRKPAAAETVKPTHNHLIIYEVDSDAWHLHPAFALTIQNPRAEKVIAGVTEMEIRRFALHKNFEAPNL